jgi:ATP synthase protein I
MCISGGGLLFDFKKHREWIDDFALVSQLGFTMVGCIVLCFFIGLYLDRWVGTRGIFLTVFTILGVVGGAYTVYRQINEILKKKGEKNNHTNNGSN